ncbi:MAG TPA: DUF4097 family beta strand repeat-containing protein [Thermoanaerobaculaceae bacterium]|nr:DUF4097 family beta strand repeat-containing protein [Thermoanaerobaculaceae bacterium]
MNRVGVLALAVAAALPAAAQQKVDETKAAAKDGTVEIHNVAGSVRVSGWDQAQVSVTGVLGRGTERLEFTTSERRAVIRVVLPHNAHHVDGSDLEIRVPQGSSLEVNTVSADVSVDKVSGEMDIESVSGGISVGGEPKRFSARSVSGDVTITAASAPGRAKSVSGDIKLAGVAGDVEAGSVSGTLSVKGDAVSRLDLETTSGDIRVDAGLAKDARVEAKTVSGTVELELPAATAADFDVTTFSGNITNDFGPAAKRTSEYGPGRELSFSTGGGGRVVAKSFSGNVHLRKK